MTHRMNRYSSWKAVIRGGLDGLGLNGHIKVTGMSDADVEKELLWLLTTMRLAMRNKLVRGWMLYFKLAIIANVEARRVAIKVMRDRCP